VAVRDEHYTVACGSRTCAFCGDRWQKDQRVRAVAAAEHLGTSVALVTVTAPGRELYRPEYVQFGAEDADVLARWNESARRRWRRLHLAASKTARRQARRDGSEWRVLYRSWEEQKRGALHVHLVLPFDTPAERHATNLYVRRLWELARAHDFGYVLGGKRGENPSWRRPPRVAPASSGKAARYVCKYVASIGTGKEGMRAIAERTRARGSVLYISPTLTRRSGVTMTSLRARRRIYARYPWGRESAEAWRIAAVVDGTQRRRAPLSPDAERTLRRVIADARATAVLDRRTGEVLTATLAPTPLKLRCDEGAPAPPQRLAHVALASVWLRDPIEPNLGHWRTTVRPWPAVPPDDVREIRIAAVQTGLAGGASCPWHGANVPADAPATLR
jgi:hypothetical protein